MRRAAPHHRLGRLSFDHRCLWRPRRRMGRREFALMPDTARGHRRARRRERLARLFDKWFAAAYLPPCRHLWPGPQPARLAARRESAPHRQRPARSSAASMSMMLPACSRPRSLSRILAAPTMSATMSQPAAGCHRLCRRICSAVRRRRKFVRMTPISRRWRESFYADSKRVSNRRIKEELGYRLLYPTYREGSRRSWRRSIRPSASSKTTPLRRRISDLSTGDDRRPSQGDRDILAERIARRLAGMRRWNVRIGIALQVFGLGKRPTRRRREQRCFRPSSISRRVIG